MAEEQVRALRALGYTKDPELIQRLLAMSTDGSVRSQDVVYIFVTLANNKEGAEPSWKVRCFGCWVSMPGRVLFVFFIVRVCCCVFVSFVRHVTARRPCGPVCMSRSLRA